MGQLTTKTNFSVVQKKHKYKTNRIKFSTQAANHRFTEFPRIHFFWFNFLDWPLINNGRYEQTNCWAPVYWSIYNFAHDISLLSWHQLLILMKYLQAQAQSEPPCQILCKVQGIAAVPIVKMMHSWTDKTAGGMKISTQGKSFAQRKVQNTFLESTPKYVCWVLRPLFWAGTAEAVLQLFWAQLWIWMVPGLSLLLPGCFFPHNSRYRLLLCPHPVYWKKTGSGSGNTVQ